MTQLATRFYNSVVRRNSVYVSSIFLGAFTFGVGFDIGATQFWDTWNKGVSHALYDVPSQCRLTVWRS